MADIIELSNRVERLKRELEEAEEALYFARCAEMGIGHGTLITYKGTIYKIAKIEWMSWHKNGKKPWVYGYKQKKDGSFSCRHQRLFDDWEILK